MAWSEWKNVGSKEVIAIGQLSGNASASELLIPIIYFNSDIGSIATNKITVNKTGTIKVLMSVGKLPSSGVEWVISTMRIYKNNIQILSATAPGGQFDWYSQIYNDILVSKNDIIHATIQWNPSAGRSFTCNLFLAYID